MRREQQLDDHDEQTRVLYDLCSMIIHNFRTTLMPLPVSFPQYLSFLPYCQPSHLPSTSTSRPPQISPAAFGSLFIGIAIALMLFGSVIFVIGFVLMPLVIALVLLFYFAWIISNLSEIGRAILWPAYDSNYKISQGN